MTTRVICQAKSELLSLVKPEISQKKASKKRKRAEFESGEDQDTVPLNQIIETFDKESELEEFYVKESTPGGEEMEGDAAADEEATGAAGEQKSEKQARGRVTRTIQLDQIPELGNKPIFICLDTKELCNLLDLKKEVILTMLNQLEQVPGRFFKVESILPAFVTLRFHTKSLEELAETDRFFNVFSSLAGKPHQGVYRCSLTKLAVELGVKPYNVPRILYSIQHNGSDCMTYDTEKESFVLQVLSVPAPESAIPMANAMLSGTRLIESALI